VAASNTIGVFDSGIGGLTVVKELNALAPNERIVYFGDTARVPYGTKSVETVRRYTAEDTELLLQQGISLLVVACNTVSAVALDVARTLAGDIPVIGMIDPAAREAADITKNGRIGIIGTQATVASKAYDEAIAREAAKQGKMIETFSVACPLFVPLAEEGLIEHQATKLIADDYLSSLREAEVDTLILGCTHYPVLRDAIQEAIGKYVTLINSGAVAAREVEDYI
jgi:glutamate racemase